MCVHVCVCVCVCVCVHACVCVFHCAYEHVCIQTRLTYIGLAVKTSSQHHSIWTLSALSGGITSWRTHRSDGEEHLSVWTWRQLNLPGGGWAGSAPGQWTLSPTRCSWSRCWRCWSPAVTIRAPGQSSWPGEEDQIITALAPLTTTRPRYSQKPKVNCI
jgi:hypothetical protein